MIKTYGSSAATIVFRQSGQQPYSFQRVRSAGNDCVPRLWAHALDAVSFSMTVCMSPGIPVVQKGLTWEGFRWALTYGGIGHWHPLTWLSHMLDCQFYGLNAGGHHLTNVLLHTATVILLFLLLRQMTGCLWRSAFVAAVFAVHPLRAESVAWMAERKDVFSGLFFMLTLAAYVRYVRCPPSMIRYGSVVLCFALGLLSKNMLVTLPFVLLLLDYWPLNRLPEFSSGILLRRVIEKAPLFVLTMASCVITFLVPEKLTGYPHLPLGLRLENAVVSYVTYLWQMIYPSGLACLYPNPTTGLPYWQAAGAAGLLLAVSGMVWAFRRSRPWLLVGWLWYLGMMIPVIGIVQISYYAHADRYTYLPQIGVYLAIVWAVAGLTTTWRYRGQILATVASIIIIALAVCTWRQISYWKNDESLWKHAIACTRGNYIAQNNLGYDLAAHGQTGEAVEHYQKALQINPNCVDCNNNLGTALLNQRRLEEASAHYHQALDKDPAFAEAHNNLGIVLTKQGRPVEAIEEYRKAIELNPDRAEFYNNLGNLLAAKGQTSEAIEQFQRVLEVKPDYAKAHYNLANVFAAQGRLDEAIEHYRRALERMPDFAHARYQWGACCNIRASLKGRPRWRSFGKNSLELDPRHVPAQNNLAWLWATCPDDSLRNGNRAVGTGTAGSATFRWQVSGDSGYAGGGLRRGRTFLEAIETIHRAMELSAAQNNASLTEAFKSQLRCYETNTPYREKL